MKQLLSFSALVIISLSMVFLPGCNTVKGTAQGLNQDINSISGKKEPTSSCHHQCKSCKQCKHYQQSNQS